MSEDFAPSDRQTQKAVAKHLLEFVEMMNGIVFFGDAISKRDKKKFKRGLDAAVEIAHALEKGKNKAAGIEIYKDPEDWNLIQ